MLPLRKGQLELATSDAGPVPVGNGCEVAASVGASLDGT
jgi:hypothetical protein